MADDESYCEADTPGAEARTGESTGPSGPPYAECVLCREPTEYPESTKGSTLCPVCEWREAERAACSG
ncbi:hypothetical protein ACIBI4_33330 [Streptomyces sp. NPDC050418]|uniref:hypothetical protein n=1 Tax=Streptomyces sp. NPDC050418 TaxID=3365612 RepID=UPI0037A0A710